jgi:hypothetical protein
MLKKILTLIFLTTLTLTFFQSCDSTEPNDKRKLTLSVEDVSTTEVRLRLSATEIQLPANISITKNSTFAKLITLKSNDSLFTVDSLQPSTSYSLQAIYDEVKSNAITAVTMDTTTQNFTFETVEFGDGFSSSYFNDVWIFDENNIWAVGNVFTDDSTDGNLYHWDGNYWKAVRLNFVDLEGIWGINNTLYFASVGLWKYQNSVLTRQNISGTLSQGQGVHKLWGSSESNIWGVGPWGTIVHYDGNGWAKIEFDNELSFYNITGNKETGTAYAIGRRTGDIIYIVELKENEINVLYKSSERSHLIKSKVIEYCDQKLYLGGSDIVSLKVWEYDLVTKEVELSKDFIETSRTMDIRQISVNNYNDIYYIGKMDGLGRMIHYNGFRYTEIGNDLMALNNSGNAQSINNLCVSVGYVNNKAYITKIKRN